MLNDRTLTLITILLLATGAGCIGYVFYNSSKTDEFYKQTGITKCVKETLVLKMNDGFMKGMLNKGDSYKVLKNYYECNDIERDNMVWLRISPPIEPVVKIVRGLPGDKFEVTQNPAEKAEWTIKINDKTVQGDNGDFIIRAQHTPPLKTYEISRKGVLKKNEYILFSYRSPGLSDSSNLGIIKKPAIEGKVLLLPKEPQAAN